MKKLIRYEFAEFLPEEDRLYPNEIGTQNLPDDQKRIEELEEENHRLLQRVRELEDDKADLKRDKEMLQLHIQTLTGSQTENGDKSKTA